MFPHFLKEREIISSSPQVFASSCFVSPFMYLGFWSWSGLFLVRSCSAWRAGRGAYRGLSRLDACLSVS